MPVGAGRRKNKNGAPRSSEGKRDKGSRAGKAAGIDAGKEQQQSQGFSAAPFSPLMLEAMAYPPSLPGKPGLPGFVPGLALPGPLNPLAAVPGFQTIVDPGAAAAAAAALPARLAAGVDPLQFLPPLPASSARASCLSATGGEDGSCEGRRVRARKDSSGPDSSSQHGSACTAADLPGSRDHPGQLGGSVAPADLLGSVSGFQPFNGGGAQQQQQPGGGAGMAQADWLSMAQQQQAAAVQQQMQYQAAMQAQAMQAAAAGAWGQGSNPYLSGLCFPYASLYGAGPQWAAAYARCCRAALCNPPRSACCLRMPGFAIKRCKAD